MQLLFRLLVLFMLGSFIGSIVERVTDFIPSKKHAQTNPFFYQPPYGIGLIILYLISSLSINLWFIIALLVIVPTLMEIFIGFFCKYVLKMQFWDYSDHFLNYCGMVSLPTILAWGALGVLFYFFILGPLNKYILFNSNSFVYYAFLVLGIVFFVYAVGVMIYFLKNIKKMRKRFSPKFYNK